MKHMMTLKPLSVLLSDAYGECKEKWRVKSIQMEIITASSFRQTVNHPPAHR